MSIKVFNGKESLTNAKLKNDELIIVHEVAHERSNWIVVQVKPSK